MPDTRRKKYVRSKASPLLIQARDRALLRDLAEYRFLNTEQIFALHGGGKRNLLRRLATLFDNGLLDKPKTPRLGSGHTVFALGEKAVDELATDAAEREKLLRRIRETKRTSAIVAHAMMISQFRVCLMLALKKRPDIKFIRWMQGNDLRAHTPSLVPDAFFLLESETHMHPCFLEADRGTETQETFTNKLRTYWRLNRAGGFEKSLGVENFRVLTITETKGRAESLCRGAKEADDRRTGSPVFIFAPENIYSTKSPDGLLEANWLCPKDDLPHAVIE